MEKCFVIQPFDNDKFDRRYKDIYSKVIFEAGLEPYRVDKDLSVRVPIDDIERGIKEARICFADITLDNPNVWFELGFALALNKEVILVCSEERTDKYPFDIQHRHVTKYNTGSSSDFEKLKTDIKSKLDAYLKTSLLNEHIKKSPVKTKEGLESYEIAMLLIILENTLTPDDGYSAYHLKSNMNKSGFTEAASGLAIRLLVEKMMIEVVLQYDEWNNGEASQFCKLTSIGEQWIKENKELIEIKYSEDNKFEEDDDDVPF